MPKQINILNFDQIYRYQPFLKQKNCNWIDLQSIPRTNLFCSNITLKRIANILQDTLNNKITLIGSGNYHYISYIYLSYIDHPFTLILFDHHTDTLPSPSHDLISCGSWVLAALKTIPQLKKVMIIGVNEDGKNHIPVSFKDKVRLFPKTVLQRKFISTIHNIMNNIKTQNVYISIDKDVLSKRYALTSWDQGNMSLQQLLTIVKLIMQHKQVDMIDICGEYPISPSNEFSKKVLKANKINDYANKLMIDSFQQWFKQFAPITSLKHA